jgi:mannose-6-phosphate isomerase-like protein (cupin superfamily)
MGNIEHRLPQIRADWQARGYSFDYWIDPPGQVWPGFTHPVDELLVLIEGELEISAAGRTFRPAVGEEVMIPAGVLHTVRNTGEACNRWCFGYRSSDTQDEAARGRSPRGATDSDATRKE